MNRQPTTTTREEIVQEARTWLGTPFHHQARLKGVGCDCVGLVIGVARALALVAADFDVPAYPRTPDGTSLLALTDQHLAPITKAFMQPGDVVVLAFDKDPQHLAVLGNYRHGGLSIIHAHSVHGAVVESRLMFSSSLRFVAAYSLPGVA